MKLNCYLVSNLINCVVKLCIEIRLSMREAQARMRGHYISFIRNKNIVMYF
jgi:hypothetical protein